MENGKLRSGRQSVMQKNILCPSGSLFKLKVENGKLRYYPYTTKHPATGAGCFIIMHYEID